MPAGCAIDLLLVVDNSGSMNARIATLVEGLPALTEGLEGIDLRAMVIDADADPAEGCTPACESECYVDGVCNTMDINCFVSCATCQDFDCNAPAPEACDVTLGSGLVFEQGNGNAACDFASGERWIDSSEPDFTGALQCASNVGFASTAGTERVMEGMTAVFQLETDAMACNGDFVRPEAGLGILIVTDEDDAAGDSIGSVDFWRIQVETSQVDPERIAVAAIIGDNAQPGALCEDKGDNAARDPGRIRAFVDGFGDRGLTGSICEVDYTATLAAFAETIAGLCE